MRLTPLFNTSRLSCINYVNIGINFSYVEQIESDIDVNFIKKPV